MNDNEKRNMKSRMKWQQVILILAILAFLTGLVIVSAVSYFQTEQSFQTLNDKNIVFLGVSFGMMISNAFSLLFQYGQNAVLFIRKSFLDDDKWFEIVGYPVSQKDVALWIFFLFAGIDALTNCLWYYQTVEPNENIVLRIVISIVGYSAMIVSVFVEEAIGFTLDALMKAFSGLKEIVKWEKRKENSENREQGGRGDEKQQTPYRGDRPSNFDPDKNKPNFNDPRMRQPYQNQPNQNPQRPQDKQSQNQTGFRKPSVMPPDRDMNRNNRDFHEL